MAAISLVAAQQLVNGVGHHAYAAVFHEE